MLASTTTPIITAANAPSALDRLTTYTYDPGGRKIGVSAAAGPQGTETTDSSQLFGYYPDDRLATQTGRSSAFQSAPTITSTYLPDGSPKALLDTTASVVVSATNRNVDTHASPLAPAFVGESGYYLDGLAAGVTDGTWATTYAYDGQGTPISRVDATGTVTAPTITQTETMAHNDAGLATALTDSLTAGTTTFAYDRRGLPATQITPTGETTSWCTNPDTTLASHTVTPAGATVTCATGTATPSTATLPTVTGGTATANFAYGYDGLERISDQLGALVRAGTGTSSGDFRYGYSPAGRIVTFNDGISHAISWDHNGNRVAYSGVTYTYRADNSILTTSSSPTAFTYNNATGDLTSDSTNCYAYDGYDRKAVTGPIPTVGNPCTASGSTGATYTYDGLDRQTSHTEQTSPSTPTTIHYDGWSTQLVNETSTASTSGNSTYEIGPAGTAGFVQSVLTAGPTLKDYLNDDGQGNVTTLTSAQTNICTTRYDPFGSPEAPATGGNGVCQTATTPTTLNDLWYRAGRRDQSTGQYQDGSRTYDPNKNSFLTPDTRRTQGSNPNLSIGTDPLTQNTYTYVNGDPINLADPTGHDGADLGSCFARGYPSIICTTAGDDHQHLGFFDSTQRPETALTESCLLTPTCGNDLLAGRAQDRRRSVQQVFILNRSLTYAAGQLDRSRPGAYFGDVTNDQMLAACYRNDATAIGAVLTHDIGLAAYANNNAPQQCEAPNQGGTLQTGTSLATALLTLAEFVPAIAITVLLPEEAIGVDVLFDDLAAEGVGGGGRAIVIGEDMEGRVIPTAERLGADYYNPLDAPPSEWMENNRQWINDRMDEGCTIYDCGAAPGRVNYPDPTSPYYQMELDEIAKRGYPTIPVQGPR